MIELIRLIKILEKRARKSLDAYLHISEENLEVKLYLLVRDGKVKTDSQAMLALYGSELNAKGYKMLKSRLIKKLFSAIDQVDLSDKELLPYAYIEHQCLIKLNRVLTLLRLAEHHLAHKFVQQAIGLAKKIDNVGLLLRCYEYAYNATGLMRDEVLFNEYEQELKHYKRISDIEFEVDVTFQRAKLFMLKSNASRAAIIRELPQIMEDMRQKWLETQSTKIFRYWQYIFNFYHETAGNFAEVIRNADKVETMVRNKQISDLNVDLRYYKFVKLFALQQLQQYEEGLRFAQTIESSFIYGSTSWSSYIENYFLLAIHNRSYKLAGKLIQQFLSSGVAEILSQLMKERWTLNIQFYNLIASIDKSAEPVNSPGFEELLKISQHDKEGYNVAIIILEFFNLLQQKGELDPSSHIDRIRKYIAKHLNKKGTERPRLFLKLVLLMLREKLDPIGSRAKGRYLFKKLRATPMQTEAFAEVEIIPYEQLWELALQRLQQRKQSMT
ncbi:hypothetical protein ACMA1I_22620 [Pontibacter sp. 13R65]|uniref:hypothetical protein n=1 Tax=Pontibacter sp. 13R65 TaxID=3127458 RepID=UPI00301D930F